MMNTTPNKVTWVDFESTVNDEHRDFEDFCRLFFKIYYLGNVDVFLRQTTNNAGLETDPVSVKNTMIGFQAKYYRNNTDYANIYNSMEKVVKYYKGNVDQVVLYCNKDIDTTCTSYKNINELLNKNGIILSLCCNNDILDEINLNDKYEKLKAVFFGRNYLKDNWFKEEIENELNDLNPRYVKGFHISDPDIETYFDFIYKNENILEVTKKLILEWKEKVRKSIISDGLKEKLDEKINGLCVPQLCHISEVFSWKDLFESELTEIDRIISEFKAKSLTCSTGSNIEIKELDNKIKSYDEVKQILIETDLRNNKYYKCLLKNVFILQGDAGIGKSHLLGYETEKNGIENGIRSVLLLGNKLFLNSNPEKSIMEYLNIDNMSFSEFLDECELKGELDGSLTVITIDALNECSHHNVWKSYLSKIISNIMTRKYVKIILSIRRTYKDYLFNDAVNEKIKNGEVIVITHRGFSNILKTAVDAYFLKFNIPFSAKPYFEKEFSNPLFLMTYCNGYTSDDGTYGNSNLFKWYLNFVQKEEKKVKEQYGLEYDRQNYSQFILKKIGEFFLKNKQRCIPYETLKNLTNELANCTRFIDGFLSCKALVSYINSSGEEIIYVCYEKFADFIVAQTIVDKTNNVKELYDIITKEIFSTDSLGFLNNPTAMGEFGVLSILANEKYGVEIIDLLNMVDESVKNWDFDKSLFINEYLSAYKYRSDSNIKMKEFDEKVYPYLKLENMDYFQSLLIDLVGRDNELNVNYLTKTLIKLPLNERDYRWTIYIDENYEEEGKIHEIIQYFLHSTECDGNERLQFSELLVWFLSSSNRSLRDNASRALVNLLIGDVQLILKLLNIFKDVNDPYILYRFLCCVYGSILRTNRDKIDKKAYEVLAFKIFEDIFNKDKVYADILVRDYALNILEFLNYVGVRFSFDISICRPPYESEEIIGVSTKELLKLYPELDSNNVEENYGTYAIKSSLAPEHGLDDFCLMYGDFGRYIFGSSLQCFDNVDYKQIYSYAFKYIITELGYKNELFSRYDKMGGYGRTRGRNDVERIGKKYEWVTMYHILAILTDKLTFRRKYFDEHQVNYIGAWQLNVRDFDPTLSIVSNDEKMECGLKLNRHIFNSWDLTNEKWGESKDGIFDFRKLIGTSDSGGEQWIALHFSITDKSSNDYRGEYQSIWKDCTACLIRKDEKTNFLSEIKDKNLWGRWLTAAEVGDVYNLFCGEYCWSPAYNDVYKDFGFEDVEINCSEKNNYINKTIGRIRPLYNSAIWEKSVDYSINGAVSILMPDKLLVEELGLTQLQNGVWIKDGEIVCADFSHIKGSNIDGLYIKKKYFDIFLLSVNYDVVWIGLGEKIHNKGLVQRRAFKALSSLVYNENEKLIEINHVNDI